MEYKFIEDRDIIEFAEKHLHLSYSAEKEVGEFFKELKNIKGINFLEFIEKMEIELNNNRKHDTMKFLKIIREYRNPVMSKAMNKVKGLSNSVKKKHGKGKMWIYKTLLKYLKNYVNLSWR